MVLRSILPENIVAQKVAIYGPPRRNKIGAGLGCCRNGGCAMKNAQWIGRSLPKLQGNVKNLSGIYLSLNKDTLVLIDCENAHESLRAFQ
jgi:hypothetical protein